MRRETIREALRLRGYLRPPLRCASDPQEQRAADMPPPTDPEGGWERFMPYSIAGFGMALVGRAKRRELFGPRRGGRSRMHPMFVSGS